MSEHVCVLRARGIGVTWQKSWEKRESYAVYGYRRVEKYMKSGSRQRKKKKKEYVRLSCSASSGSRRKLNGKLWTLCQAMESFS